MHATDQPARAAAAVATAAPLLLATVLLAALAGGALAGPRRRMRSASVDWPPVLDAPTLGMAVVTRSLLVVLNIGVPVVALLASLHVRSTRRQMSAGIWAADRRGDDCRVAGGDSRAHRGVFSAAGQWTRGLLGLGGASFLIGGQLLAIALIRLFNRPGLAWAYDCARRAGHRLCRPLRLAGGCRRAAERGRGRGASCATWPAPMGQAPSRTALHVIWPMAWPTLLAGGLLVGALSLTEVPATVLLMPQNPQVLTPTLMTWVHMARSDPMIEASLLMMMTVLIPALSAVGLTALGVRRHGDRNDFPREEDIVDVAR